MNGKGSTRRPRAVPATVEAENWARTFGVQRTAPAPDDAILPDITSERSTVSASEPRGDAP